MKKAILKIGIAATTIILFLGIVYFFNGSLEMYPTQEQMEKAKTGAIVIIFFSLVIDIFLIRLARK